MDSTDKYLGKTSERFNAIYKKFGEIVTETFPKAEKVFAFNMPGFKIRVTDKLIPKEEWQGTMDPNYLMFFIVERKSGITLHIWNTVDYYGMDTIRDEYENAGFKVMRGCIVWNRKAEYPIGMVEKIVKRLKPEGRVT